MAILCINNLHDLTRSSVVTRNMLGALGGLLANKGGIVYNVPKLMSPLYRKVPNIDLSLLPKRCLKTTVVRLAARANDRKRSNTTVFYFISAGVFMIGASYAGVPLYRMFCQKTGFGGDVKRNINDSKIESMVPVKGRLIRVKFNADTGSNMQWNFRPQQSEIKVFAGETALAFYRAKNPTDRPIIGISTYNVVPFEAGPYFNKIQCFCFEEQRLGPHEEVDMPVFFYIDPQFCDDPLLQNTNEITLSYTFFESKTELNLPVPSYAMPED